ncbi:MAG TPA: hypothetical protein VGI45_34870 [Terracidiphilus sp.]|jgi:hypothetical protein
MSEFRTRRLDRAGENDLNECWLQFRRRKEPHFKRSLELMRWLWHEGPGGPVESWIIEAREAGGDWKIVGHHGLCPVRFTFGSRDLLVAKTMNTFLLPEYRSKFLYLRFEQNCLQQYHSRYDAVCSLGGRGIHRLRQGFGYTGPSNWIEFERGSQHLDAVTRVIARGALRIPEAAAERLARQWLPMVSSRIKPAFEWTEFNSVEARQSDFFQDFWNQARSCAGMAPRREVADLTWRYWNRPDGNVATLVHSWSSGAKAYCAIERLNPFLYLLSDIYVTPPNPALLSEVLESLFHWCARRGVLRLAFFTTTEGQPRELLEVFFAHMRLNPFQTFRMRMEFCCRVPPETRAFGVPDHHWNFTSALTPV